MAPPRRFRGASYALPFVGGALGGAMDPRPMQFDESRMGGVETLVRPAQVPAVIGPREPATPIPSKRVRILEVNLKETQRDKARLYDAGAWILTLDNVATFSAQAPGPADLLFPIVPVRAIITIGTGGSSLNFETDTRNQSFQLPGAYVAVDIDWDASVPENGAEDTWNWVLPDSVKVKAQIQRGFATNNATRTIYTTLLGGGRTSSVWLPVPQFARCVKVWGQRYSIAGPDYATLPFWTHDDVESAKLEFTSETISGSGSLLVDYRGNNLLNPSGVPVPNVAQWWRLTGNPAPESAGPVEFTLGL